MPSIPLEVIEHLGLVSDVPPVGATPGSMRLARNASAHRPGVIQPRLGIGADGTVAARTSTYRVAHIVPWSKGVQLWSVDGSSARLEDRATTTINDASAAPLSPAKADPVFFESRGSLYYAATGGIRKITSPTASAETAGIRTNYYVPFWNPSIAVSGTEYAVATQQQVAYRFAWVRQDVNGYERRSSPSSRMVVQNGTTDASPDGAVNWAIVFSPILVPAGMEAGDRLEVYRTRATPINTTPPEDYFLAFTHEVNAAEVAARITVSLTDDVEDDLLGVALYTSESQQGILQAKEAPPHAHAMAWWSDVAWYGDVVERPTVTIDVVKKAATNAFLDGLQSQTFSGSVSLGSNIISGIDEVAGITVGMGLSERDGVLTSPATAGTYLPADTTVTAIGGSPGAYTITMSAAALAGAGSVQFVAGDVVTVDGVPFYCMPGLLGSAENPSARAFQDFETTVDTAERIRRTANGLAQAVSAYTELVDPSKVVAINNNDGSITFRRPQGQLSSFTVTSTRPGAFRPALDGNLTAAPGEKTNRLYFSQPQEPEAVPLLNWLDIGQENLRIVALTALDEALLVWTDQGLFRVTGDAPDGWVVDEIEATIRLLHPRCQTVLNNVCYAFTDRGVVQVTEMGVGEIAASMPIGAELRAFQTVLTRGKVLPGRGVFMAADETFGDVILGVSSSLGAVSDREYVFNAYTSRWTTWERADRAMAYSPADDALLVAPGADAWLLDISSRQEDSPLGYVDVQLIDLAASTLSGDEITVLKTAFSGRVPVVGDILEDDTGAALIATVVDGGSTWNMTFDRAIDITSGTVTWRQGYEVELVWQGMVMRAAVDALWQELHVSLSAAGHAFLSSWSMELGGAAHRSSAPAYAPVTVDDTSYTRPLRQGIGPTVARTPHFYPAVRVRSPGALWRLGTLTAYAEPASRRVTL